MDAAGHLDTASNLVGYLGAAVVILGYFLNQRGRLSSEDWRFPAMNLLGSALVMVSLLHHSELAFGRDRGFLVIDQHLRAPEEPPGEAQGFLPAAFGLMAPAGRALALVPPTPEARLASRPPTGFGKVRR